MIEIFYQFDSESPLLKPIFGVIYAIALSNLLNIFFDKNKLKSVTAEQTGNSLYLIAFDAFNQRQLVETTMKSGKIYTGYPAKPINLKSKYFDLIPDVGRAQYSTTETTNDDIEMDVLSGLISLKVSEIATVRLVLPEA